MMVAGSFVSFVRAAKEVEAIAPRGDDRILLVYIEPAPYFVSFVDHVRAAWEGSTDVVYVTESLTQRWGYRPRGAGESLLPVGVIAAILDIRRRLASGRYR